MKNRKIYKIAIICMLMFSSFSAMADDIDDGNGNGDTVDVVAAPIDNYVPLAFIIATGLSFILICKKYNKA